MPPEAAIASTVWLTSGGTTPPSERTQPVIAPAAPLRSCVPPGRSTPLIRVCAVNGTKCAPGRSDRSRSPYSVLARTTTLRPSGVSSASDASWAASATSLSSAPPTGRNSTACRLPRVMVPVLSSSRVLTSPAASTARPLMASTLRCTSRSMPAMPIADSRAPIVVGMRQTTSAMSTATSCSAPE